MMPTPGAHIPISGADRARREGNLVRLGQKRTTIGLWCAAATAGLLTSTIFAPLDWHGYAWVSLVPILTIGLSVRRGVFALGFAFGFAHFATMFFWLRTVFFPAPFLLALLYALLPAVWLALTHAIFSNLAIPSTADLLPKNDPTIPTDLSLRGWRATVATLVPGMIWCAIEWLRSWFLTGFPWNQLGISQWQNEAILPLAAYTGVYGVSYLLVTSNVAIYLCFRRYLPRLWRDNSTTDAIAWIMTPVAVLAAIVLAVPSIRETPTQDASDAVLDVIAVQGNIPQIRTWTPEQLDLALTVYVGLTKDAVRQFQPDLVLWPETAVPASLRYDPDCRAAVWALLREIQTPLLAGTIDNRYPPPGVEDLPRTYNSAILFDRDAMVVDWYDKIHLVPFGEYVPCERFWPILVDWIGMGRSLSFGREYTIVPFGENVRMGINICYEDIFPEISRRLCLNGANLLVVITNDAWFQESSASRQHLAHAVFRAVESSRPVLRNGNNSDTCLILPDGTITDLLCEPGTQNRFYRGFAQYRIPVAETPPITVYMRYGNWFAIVAVLVTAWLVGWCGYRYLDRKRRLWSQVAAE